MVPFGLLPCPARRGWARDLARIDGERVVTSRTDGYSPLSVLVHWLAARIVHWGLLLAIVVVVITGYLLPWSAGEALDVFGFGIPSPMGASEKRNRPQVAP